MTRNRMLLVELSIAAFPYLRRGLAPVGETRRHERLRLALAAACAAVGGRIPENMRAEPRPGGVELGRQLLAGALEACDALGVARSDVVVIVNAHARTPAPFQPERLQ